MIPAVILDEVFTRENFLTRNTIENIHRKNISPIELGAVVQKFMDEGFNHEEIAVRLNIPRVRINVSYTVFKKLPEKFRSMIGFIGSGENKKGKLPVSVALRILRLRMSSANIEHLINEAQKKDLMVVILTRFITS